MLGSLCMCQDSSRHLGRQLGLVSSTSAAPQSIWCCFPHACSAIADAFVSPLTALWCSFILHVREQPDCPTYVLSQSLQGILYTTPFRWSRGTGSLGLTNIWRMCMLYACAITNHTHFHHIFYVHHRHSVFIPLMKTPGEVSKRWDKI